MEVLNIFVNNPTKWYSHNDFAKTLNNLNSHKAIGFAEENGIRFQKKEVKFRNRFGRTSKVKMFSLKSKQSEAIKIYNKIN